MLRICLICILLILVLFLIIYSIFVSMCEYSIYNIFYLRSQYQNHKELSYKTNKGYYVKRGDFKNFKKEVEKELPYEDANCNFKKNDSYLDVYANVYIFNKEVMRMNNIFEFFKVLKYLEEINLKESYLKDNGKWGE